MDLAWKSIEGRPKLCVRYTRLFQPNEARDIFQQLEKEVDYLSPEESQISVFGKVHNIPRLQAAFGDAGVSYTFSNTTIAAKPWTFLLKSIKECVEAAAGETFNFALVNKYRSGEDHIGPHKDSNKNLNLNSSIASLSLGATRDFYLRHEELKRGDKTHSTVWLALEEGTLLLMSPPTNQYYYHGLPVRKGCQSPRINITFRQLYVTNESQE